MDANEARKISRAARQRKAAKDAKKVKAVAEILKNAVLQYLPTARSHIQQRLREAAEAGKTSIVVYLGPPAVQAKANRVVLEDLHEDGYTIAYDSSRFSDDTDAEPIAVVSWDETR